MNNPADTLAALARKVNGVRVRWPEMDTSDDSLEEVEDSLRALASLKGDAERPMFWISAADLARANAEGDNVVACPATGEAPEDSIFLYTTPPAPQAAGEGFKLQCEVAVAPATMFGVGTSLSSVIASIKSRSEPDPIFPGPYRFSEAFKERRLHPTPSPAPQGASYQDFVRLATDPNRKPAPQGGGEAICEALVNLVEGLPVHRWAADGVRLKDTPEWVAFYNLVRRLK